MYVCCLQITQKEKKIQCHTRLSADAHASTAHHISIFKINIYGIKYLLIAVWCVKSALVYRDNPLLRTIVWFIMCWNSANDRPTLLIPLMPVLLQTVLIGIFFRKIYCYNNFERYLFLTGKKIPTNVTEKRFHASEHVWGFKKSFQKKIIVANHFYYQISSFFLAIESQDLLNKSKENIRFVHS